MALTAGRAEIEGSVAQHHGGRARADAQIVAETRFELAVAAEHGVAITGGERPIHHRHTGLLAAGVESEQLIPSAGGDEHVAQMLAHALASTHGPVRIRQVGQQITAVDVECGRHRFVVVGSGCFDDRHVDGDLAVGEHRNHLIPHHDGVGGIGGVPSERGGLAETVGRRAHLGPRPEGIHDLLAVKTVPGGQGEQRQQLGSGSALEVLRCDPRPVQMELEPAQEHEAHRRHHANKP